MVYDMNEVLRILELSVGPDDSVVSIYLKVLSSKSHEIYLMSFYSLLNIQWLSPHLLLSQHCSLTPSPTALLRMCTVSHPLPLHAHPVLTIQSTVPHSLSMHVNLNRTLPPTPLWCSCQVTMYWIQISQLTV